MCDKVNIENVEQLKSRTLKSVPDCYKNQEICSKAIDNYPHVLKFVTECLRLKNFA